MFGNFLRTYENKNNLGVIILKLDRSKFNKLVAKKETDNHNKGLNSWSHLVWMLFC